MAPHYYTYRIRIANRDRVWVERPDPDDRRIRDLSGGFGYKGEIKARIQELHRAAYAGDLAGPDVEELGEKLFIALFDERLLYDFFRLYRKAHDEKTLLRLELDVDESHLPEIAALPWEFMRVPSNLDYPTCWLGTVPDLIFSRRRAGWRAAEPIRLKAGDRLRIALVVAEPEGLGTVRYKKIWQALKKLASEQPKRIELLELVNPAKRDSIDEVLKKEPHIFHFIGHGRLRGETQRDIGQIALVDSTDQPSWHKADDFSEFFIRHQPGVVVLQACEGGASSASEAFVGLASQVVQQNIPVVVAMQYEISNSTARRFVLEFYRRLSENDPVDKAVQEGRREIAMGPTGYNKRDFATPVLFMRVQDGRLFDICLDEIDYGRRDVGPVLKDSELEDVYMEGVGFLYAEEYEKAIEYFQRVAQVNPDYRDVKARMEEARRESERAKLEAKVQAAEDKADWSIAVEALQALREFFPDDPDLPDQLARAEQQMQLKNFWEQAEGLYMRQKWQAVVKCFEKMRAIDPDLPDSEGWLAEAEEALRQQQVERLVKLHLHEAVEHMDREEWGKALNALNSVLKLDPDHEIAAKLHSKVQAEMAQAKAAALLAERYDKAKQAMADQNWEEAVDLLKVVSREDPDYQNLAALLKEASEQLANTQAELDLTLSVKPKRVKPNSDATWALTVNNYSPVTITNIVARKKGGDPLEKPFDLKSGESKEITFTTYHTTQGARRHIVVEGTSPIGRPVQAEVRAAVSIVQPPPKKEARPEPSPPPAKPKPSPSAQKSEPKLAQPAPQPIQPPVTATKPRQRVGTPGYREALHRAKDVVDLGDNRANHVINLIEEGEKHYRIARGLIARPHNWDQKFSDWQDAVARLKSDKIVMISFAPATPSTILQEMATIAREIKHLIGVEIPLQELQNL